MGKCQGCGGWGFDIDGQDCPQCNRERKASSIRSKRPQPPAWDPNDPDANRDLTESDWWKQDEEN